MVGLSAENVTAGFFVEFVKIGVLLYSVTASLPHRVVNAGLHLLFDQTERTVIDIVMAGVSAEVVLAGFLVEFVKIGSLLHNPTAGFPHQVVNADLPPLFDQTGRTVIESVMARLSAETVTAGFLVEFVKIGSLLHNLTAGFPHQAVNAEELSVVADLTLNVTYENRQDQTYSRLA